MAKWNTTLEPWMPPVAQRCFEDGKTIAETAVYLRVTKARLGDWLAEGASETCKDEQLVEFAQDCLDARNKWCGEAREVWREHCLTDAKAMHAEMKALFPEMYERGQHKTVDVTVNQKKPLLDLRDLTPEEMRLREQYEEMEERIARKRLKS